jgi:hypothetical protein
MLRNRERERLLEYLEIEVTFIFIPRILCFNGIRSRDQASLIQKLLFYNDHAFRDREIVIWALFWDECQKMGIFLIPGILSRILPPYQDFFLYKGQHAKGNLLSTRNPNVCFVWLASGIGVPSSFSRSIARVRICSTTRHTERTIRDHAVCYNSLIKPVSSRLFISKPTQLHHEALLAGKGTYSQSGEELKKCFSVHQQHWNPCPPTAWKSKIQTHKNLQGPIEIHK